MQPKRFDVWLAVAIILTSIFVAFFQLTGALVWLWSNVIRRPATSVPHVFRRAFHRESEAPHGPTR